MNDGDKLATAYKEYSDAKGLCEAAVYNIDTGRHPYFPDRVDLKIYIDLYNSRHSIVPILNDGENKLVYFIKNHIQETKSEILKQVLDKAKKQLEECAAKFQEEIKNVYRL